MSVMYGLSVWSKSDRNHNGPIFIWLTVLPSFDPCFSALCIHMGRRVRKRERDMERRVYVCSSAWLYISNSLSIHWLIFVQMASEYLQWKSTGLEISLHKTEIICVTSKYNPVVYVPGIFFMYSVISSLFPTFQCPPLTMVLMEYWLASSIQFACLKMSSVL